jgi:hypothetical protein
MFGFNLASEIFSTYLLFIFTFYNFFELTVFLLKHTILMCQTSAQFIQLFIFDILSELAIALFIKWLVLILLVFIKFSIIWIDLLGSPHLTLY